MPTTRFGLVGLFHSGAAIGPSAKSARRRQTMQVRQLGQSGTFGAPRLRFQGWTGFVYGVGVEKSC